MNLMSIVFERLLVAGVRASLLAVASGSSFWRAAGGCIVILLMVFGVTNAEQPTAGSATSIAGNPADNTLEGQRAARLEAVLGALKKGEAETLAANVPGLSREEATAMIQRISLAWGDLSKLTIRKAPGKLDKGQMKVIAHWGTDATTVGTWLELGSEAAPGRWLRIGMLFAKDESRARQFMAVEWPADVIGKE